MTTSHQTCHSVFAVCLFAVTLVLSSCTSVPDQAQSRSDNPLLGWFKLKGADEQSAVTVRNPTFIPVFLREGNYYSVCRGVEIPFKECPEGLEWALQPSSMAGTKIGWDSASETHYLVVVDEVARNASAGRDGWGKRCSMIPVQEPPGLRDERVRRPRSNHDFVGWYQPVWFPWVTVEVYREGNRHMSRTQEFREPEGWTASDDAKELKPLSDRPGFSTFDGLLLTYNEALHRYELVKKQSAPMSAAIRIPLARVSPPISDGGELPVPAPMRIGIPSWH